MGRSRLLTQKELAEFLGLTTRQIRNLEKEGVIPTEALGAKKFYPWPQANLAYIAYREELRAGSHASGLEHARQRKVAAEAELAELSAAQRRGELIPLEYHERRVGHLLDRLRSQLLAVPGYWGPEMVGLKDVREAVGRVRPLAHQLLHDLTTMAESWEEDIESSS